MKRSREMFVLWGYGTEAFCRVIAMHGICHASGKIGFATRGAAMRAWLGAKGRTNDRRRREVYECSACGLFHFGQSKVKARGAEEAKRFRRAVREVFQELEDMRFLRK